MFVLGKPRKARQAQAQQSFSRAYAQAGADVQFLLQASDLLPIYISSNFQQVLGVEPVRLEDDAYTLYRFLPDADRRRLERALGAWDRSQPLREEVTYLSPASEAGEGGNGSGSASSAPGAPGAPSASDAAAPEKRLAVTVAPVLDGACYLVTLNDVTASYRQLQDLRAELASTSEQAQERTDFLSQMSHEIRTPLNGIKGMLALAREHRGDESRLLDDLDRADELSAYLLSLVNDVLDMSRLDSGRVELEMLPFDMRLVASELRSMFEKQAADKGLDYTVEMEGCDDVFLVGDAMRLNQIVVNFISNALKFTDRGGKVTITMHEMHRDDDAVTYMIRTRDTGKGMDPRFVSRIFKPFEQEDATIARRYGGTGLGMAITNSLVSLMQGEIVVNTEIGRGSDFVVYIPFKIASETQVEELEAEGKTLESAALAGGEGAEYDFAGKRFLMAEDNEINAMIAIDLLEERGAAVDHADDGPVVVQMFADSEMGTYDAILMDIQMPTFNGWEATRRIRALDHVDARSIPIIALSANNYAEDARRSREAGMNGHAGKPIDFDELRAQLASATAEQAFRGGRQ